MAIRFVDVGPAGAKPDDAAGGEAALKPARPHPRRAAPPSEPDAVEPAADGPCSLPAEPETEPRGSEAAAPSAGVKRPRRSGRDAGAPLFDGLLPDPPAPPTPTRKPRGRKGAFG